jgi:hypothetical protein
MQTEEKYLNQVCDKDPNQVSKEKIRMNQHCREKLYA